MPPSSSSSKPPPLPLAPDRAAISNKISLLLSSRTSLLKTLNPPSAASQTTNTQRRHHQAISSDDIEQLFSGPRPNEGVGYVPDAKAAAGKDATSKEDRMLRGRLLGKGRNQKGGKKTAFAAESESDEEPGRSGLGKRKRLRREGVVAVAEEQVDKVEEEEKVANVEMGDDKRQDAVVEDETGGSGGNDIDDDERERNKKEKKRKKRQREKQKQKQKQANPGS